MVLKDWVMFFNEETPLTLIGINLQPIAVSHEDPYRGNLNQRVQTFKDWFLNG